MAGNMVPYSNPSGRNQTTPGAGGLNQGGSGGVLGTTAGVIPVTSTASTLAPIQTAIANPLIPQVPTAGLSGTPAPGATGTNDANQNKQLVDIFGKGVGGDLNNLLDSIGGTDSATLQEYIKSLAPQEATAQASLNASLGAGGVSANSSVAALGDANLQAQETAAIAGEEAQLTQSGQNLEAELLTGMQPSAEKEVASSGWDVFGSVLNDIGSLGGEVIGAAGKAGGFSELFS